MHESIKVNVSYFLMHLINEFFRLDIVFVVVDVVIVVVVAILVVMLCVVAAGVLRVVVVGVVT